MKKGLANPAAVALLNSEAGQKAISNKLDNQKAVVQAATSVLPFVIKSIVVVGIGAIIYYKIVNRFVSFSENKNYPQSNITDNQAAAKAETIYQAMKGFGNGFEIVKQAIAGINYNGFVKIYNAFGSRQGVIPFSGKMTLTEWFNDQFNEEELAQLNFLVPNIFSKTVTHGNY